MSLASKEDRPVSVVYSDHQPVPGRRRPLRLPSHTAVEIDFMNPLEISEQVHPPTADLSDINFYADFPPERQAKWGVIPLFPHGERERTEEQT